MIEALLVLAIMAGGDPPASSPAPATEATEARRKELELLSKDFMDQQVTIRAAELLAKLIRSEAERAEGLNDPYAASRVRDAAEIMRGVLDDCTKALSSHYTDQAKRRLWSKSGKTSEDGMWTASFAGSANFNRSELTRILPTDTTYLLPDFEGFQFSTVMLIFNGDPQKFVGAKVQLSIVDAFGDVVASKEVKVAPIPEAKDGLVVNFLNLPQHASKVGTVTIRLESETVRRE